MFILSPWYHEREYLEKSRELQRQLSDLRTEIEGLKVAGKPDMLDRIHLESVGKGENKFSTMQKVHSLYIIFSCLSVVVCYQEISLEQYYSWNEFHLKTRTLYTTLYHHRKRTFMRRKFLFSPIKFLKCFLFYFQLQAGTTNSRVELFQNLKKETFTWEEKGKVIKIVKNCRRWHTLQEGGGVIQHAILLSV